MAEAGKTALQYLRTALAGNRQAYGVTLDDQHRMIHVLAVGGTVGPGVGGSVGPGCGGTGGSVGSPRKWMNCLRQVSFRRTGRKRN